MPATSAATLHEEVVEALQATNDIRSLPDDWLDTFATRAKASRAALRRAVHAVYGGQVYRLEKDLRSTERDLRTLAELRRVLQIAPNEADKMRREVGLRLFRRVFRKSVEDGRLDTAENESLNRIRSFYGLSKEATNGCISDLSLAHYALLLAEATKDERVTDEELAHLTAFSKQFGLSKQQVQAMPVPDAEAVLRSALNEITSKGDVAAEDRDHIKRLASILNADSMLAACMKDLDLHECLLQVRSGNLPIVDTESIMLHAGERLHYRVPVNYERTTGGRRSRLSGDMYIGSMRMRFVSKQRSHEVLYKNLLVVHPRISRTARPCIDLSLGKGTGTGTYRLKRKDPGLAIEIVEALRFLVRKAKGLADNRGRDTAYVNSETRSEVWYRDGGKCVICGSAEYLEFDHVIPRSKGGATSVENLQILCKACNASKSDRI